jgi:peptidyl-tRNA hydrolase, PTH1 family
MLPHTLHLFFSSLLSSLPQIADDVALDCGVVRIKEKGSHGGHNGHRDIEAALGTRDYCRLRVGVSAPKGGRGALADHVLGKFSPSEQQRMDEAVMRCCDIIDDWLLTDDLQLVTNKHHTPEKS